MLKFFPLLILGAAVVLPAAVQAQTPAPASAGPPIFRADAFVGTHALGWAGAAMIGPVIDASSARASPDRSYAAAYEAAPRGGQSPTAVDYSLARDGLHGSVGYICLSDIAPQAPHESAVFAGSDEGRLVGASLKYPLR